MANKNLFQTSVGQISGTYVRNEAGGSAYQFSERHILAQYAATGCLNSTFYADAQDQLQTVLDLCEEIDEKFIAQTAIYVRKQGKMKDMPALLCAILAARKSKYFEKAFLRVIDSAKMLRNFVQIIRSGLTGRRSLGSVPRALIRKWLASRTNEQLFTDSIGNDPSLADIIKMVHPKPENAFREAMFAYLLDQNAEWDKLPKIVQDFENYKKDPTGRSVPAVPFQLLTSLSLGQQEWTEIALNTSWQTVRMNLNTFARHGVFKDSSVAESLAEKLCDPEQIRRARVFPYQLMAAFINTKNDIPACIKNALQDAMEIATDNIPVLNGKLAICVDVSGSMRSPVTGHRKGSSSKVQCVDVAALIASVFLRKNTDAVILPFDTSVHSVALNARDSVMTNANKLQINGGGTACSVPLNWLNQHHYKADYILMVSDNESWVDSRYMGTEMMCQWHRFTKKNPQAKMICINIQPYRSGQAPDTGNIANVGGFSDTVFSFIESFFSMSSENYWVKTIEQIDLDHKEPDSIMNIPKINSESDENFLS